MILYLIAGILFGAIGGMGMGGGIILIPFLTLLLGESQHSAQGLNLLAFLPMSLFALIAHFKRKRICLRLSLSMAAAGLLGAILGALLANILHGEILRKFFGGFLILLAFTRIFKKFKNKSLSNP